MRKQLHLNLSKQGATEHETLGRMESKWRGWHPNVLLSMQCRQIEQIWPRQVIPKIVSVDKARTQ